MYKVIGLPKDNKVIIEETVNEFLEKDSIDANSVSLIKDFSKSLEEKLLLNSRFLKTTTITEYLDEYLTEDSRKLISNKLTENKNIVYLGCNIERKLREIEKAEDQNTHFFSVKDEELKRFASYINIATEQGLISKGVLCEPLILDLAIVSPSNRRMMFLCCYSDHSIEELKKKNVIFRGEGELAEDLSDIPELK